MPAAIHTFKDDRPVYFFWNKGLGKTVKKLQYLRHMKNTLKLAAAAVLVAVGTLIYFIYLRPSTIISKAEAKEKFRLPESHFLQWRGGDIHYVDEGSGFPILMIHGLAGSHRNFGAIARRLKRDYRCIRVDLPGFGLSDCPQAPAHDYRKLYSDFFAFFLDTLNLHSFYLMGNSMGGWIAWEMAVRYPERIRKLVLICSAGYDMEKVAEKLSRGMRSSSVFVEKLMSRGIPYSVTRRNVEYCFADVSRINKEEVEIANALTNREGNFHTILELLRHRKDSDTSRISTIQCPVLIVWGKKDNIIPYTHAYRFQRDIPNNRLILYDDCGHVPMIEKAEEFERDFRKFVQEG